MEMLCEVWDTGMWECSTAAVTQKCDCRLSWVGGIPVKKSVPEEFGAAFGSKAGRGLMSRMILGYSPKQFRWNRHWKPLPEIVTASEDFLDYLPPCITNVTPEPDAIYEAWSSPVDEDGRMKQNLMRVSLISAMANNETVVTPECMKAACRFFDWQAGLRLRFRVGEAENILDAKFAEVAIETLRRKGAETEPVNWKTVANWGKWVKRFGGPIVERGIKSMVNTGVLKYRVEETQDGKVENKSWVWLRPQQS
jgi:hypothetical protein